MKKLYNINELTVWPFLLYCALRREPIVLGVEPWFPPLRNILKKTVDRSIAKQQARWIVDLCSEDDRIALWEYPMRMLNYNVFGETESWHNDYFEYDSLESFGIDDYIYPYKQLTCNYVKQKHFEILMLEGALRENRGLGKIQIIGLPQDTNCLFGAYWKQHIIPPKKSWVLLRSIFNAVVSLCFTLYSVAWVLIKIRMKPPPAEKIFFAADYISDPRDFELYHEVAEGGRVLIVPRNDSVKILEDVRTFEFCNPGDGWFGPAEGLKSLWMILRDSGKLFHCFRHRFPYHFYQIAVLPYRRAVLRAFFSRFKVENYWGRDDYNVEHILRRQEIQRIGGRSMGINHGYAALTCITLAWRYISFDRYYVFGRAHYERYMKQTWADDMTVVPVGTFGAKRAEYKIRTCAKPKDIVIFSAVLVGHPDMVEFVQYLARTFSDRNILLQIKSTFINTPTGQTFAKACLEGFDNVKLVTAPLMELFTQARYSFSDPSTVVVEAMQMGLYSFCIDVNKIQKSGLMREFPGVCVWSGEEAAQRIREIEAGEWRYPRQSYDDLISMSGEVIYDVIRQDLGLPPKEQAVLLPDIATPC